MKETKQITEKVSDDYDTKQVCTSLEILEKEKQLVIDALQKQFLDDEVAIHELFGQAVPASDKSEDQVATCSICMGYLYNQQRCEHCDAEFCSICIQNNFKSSKDKKCPNCRQGNGKQFKQPNRKLKNLLDQTMVKCFKCSQEMKLEKLGKEEHLMTCIIKKTECPLQCGQQLNTYKELLDHFKNYCYMAKYKCQHCGELEQRIRKSIHEKLACREIPVPCFNDECSVMVPRSKLEGHLKNDCQFQKVKCQLCQAMQPRYNLKTHMDLFCQKAKVPCQYCGQVHSKEEMQRHQGEECSEFVVRCQRCNESYQRKCHDKHLAVCDYLDIQCQDCGECFLRKNMATHKLNCSHALTQCSKCSLQVKKKDLTRHDCFSLVSEQMDIFENQTSRIRSICEVFGHRRQSDINKIENRVGHICLICNTTLVDSKQIQMLKYENKSYYKTDGISNHQFSGYKWPLPDNLNLSQNRGQNNMQLISQNSQIFKSQHSFQRIGSIHNDNSFSFSSSGSFINCEPGSDTGSQDQYHKQQACKRQRK